MIKMQIVLLFIIYKRVKNNMVPVGTLSAANIILTTDYVLFPKKKPIDLTMLTS